MIWSFSIASFNLWRCIPSCSMSVASWQNIVLSRLGKTITTTIFVSTTISLLTWFARDEENSKKNCKVHKSTYVNSCFITIQIHFKRKNLIHLKYFPWKILIYLNLNCREPWIKILGKHPIFLLIRRKTILSCQKF